MFCWTLLYVHSSFAIILMGKRGLVALLSLSSRCLVMVVWLFLVVPWDCLRFVIVTFPDHTHFLFLNFQVNIVFPSFFTYCLTPSRALSAGVLFIISDRAVPCFVCLFDLILYVPSTIFLLCRDGYFWIEPVLIARIIVSCSRTQLRFNQV